jgi:hypothetical protein
MFTLIPNSKPLGPIDKVAPNPKSFDMTWHKICLGLDS